MHHLLKGKNSYQINAGFARNPTKASTPAGKLAQAGRGAEKGTERNMSPHIFSLRLCVSRHMEYAGR